MRKPVDACLCPKVGRDRIVTQIVQTRISCAPAPIIRDKYFCCHAIWKHFPLCGKPPFTKSQIQFGRTGLDRPSEQFAPAVVLVISLTSESFAGPLLVLWRQVSAVPLKHFAPWPAT